MQYVFGIFFMKCNLVSRAFSLPWGRAQAREKALGTRLYEMGKSFQKLKNIKLKRKQSNFFPIKIFVLFFFSEFSKLENVGYVTKGKVTIFKI